MRSQPIAIAALLISSACARHAPRPSAAPLAATCRAGDPGVQWTESSDAVSRTRLAEWCATVGPVLYRSRPLREAAPADMLAVISWNVHVGGGRLDELVRRLERGELTSGAPVAQYVLLLQEAYRRDASVPALAAGLRAPRRILGDVRERAADIARFSSEHGLAVLYVPSMRNGVENADAEDRGNAIVSTAPLERPRAIELPIERQRRAAAAAVVAGVRRDGTPWRLRVATAHLDTAIAYSHGGPFEARRRQAAALAEALADAPDTPTVLAGDFNTWLGDREPAIDLLRAAFPGARERGGATWRGPAGLHASLDHLFARGLAPLRVERLADRFGSDHHPLLAIVRFW